MADLEKDAVVVRQYHHGVAGPASDASMRQIRSNEKPAWGSGDESLDTAPSSAANHVPQADEPALGLFFSRLQSVAGRLGAEQRGIERVPESERTDTSPAQVGSLVSLLAAFLGKSAPCRKEALDKSGPGCC